MDTVFRAVGTFGNLLHANSLQKRPLLEDFSDYGVVFERRQGASAVNNLATRAESVRRRSQERSLLYGQALY